MTRLLRLLCSGMLIWRGADEDEVGERRHACCLVLRCALQLWQQRAGAIVIFSPAAACLPLPYCSPTKTWDPTFCDTHCPQVRTFVKQDPFVRNGLVRHWCAAVYTCVESVGCELPS